MFSWVYYKDDVIAIGTGADKDVRHYAEAFLSYVRENYHVRGEVVRREGYSSTLRGGIYLGEGRVLMAGDAAGLVDLYRGMGMDNAALSGRLVVKAIVEAEGGGRPALEGYRHGMGRVISTVERNVGRQAGRYATNESIERSLSPVNVMKYGLLMTVAAKVNEVLPPERIITLPL